MTLPTVFHLLSAQWINHRLLFRSTLSCEAAPPLYGAVILSWDVRRPCVSEACLPAGRDPVEAAGTNFSDVGSPFHCDVIPSPLSHFVSSGFFALRAHRPFALNDGLCWVKGTKKFPLNLFDGVSSRSQFISGLRSSCALFAVS